MIELPISEQLISELEEAKIKAHDAYVECYGLSEFIKMVKYDITEANKHPADARPTVPSLELFNLIRSNQYPKLTKTIYEALGSPNTRDCSSVDEFGLFVLKNIDLLERADKVLIFGNYCYEDYDGTTLTVEHGDHRFEYEGIMTEFGQKKAIGEFEVSDCYKALKELSEKPAEG